MSVKVYKALEIVRQAFELGEYDSNVIGMAGEVIAQEHFGMEKRKRGERAIDGDFLVDGAKRTVQVKAWSQARLRAYGSRTFFRIDENLQAERLPEYLLVFLIYTSKPHYEVLYCGPRDKVGKPGSSQAVRIVSFDDLLVGSSERASELLASCR